MYRQGLLCGVAVVAVCDVWARARARAVGGVRIAIVRGHVSVVVIEIHRESVLKNLQPKFQYLFFLTANATQHPRTSYLSLAIATQRLAYLVSS